MECSIHQGKEWKYIYVNFIDLLVNLTSAGKKKRLITDLDKYIKMTRIRNYVMSLYSLSKNGSKQHQQRKLSW